MAEITASAPILLVKDVVHSAEWYRDKLGFEIKGLYGHPMIGLAIIVRNKHFIMLQRADPSVIIPHWKVLDKTSNIYFWVKDIDALYQEFIDHGATIDFTLYKTPWGTKEFGINDPDEYDVTFGEVIA